MSKPHYEDVFCLGVHSLMDTGKCVLKSAGVPEPVEPTTKLTAAPQGAVTPVTATR